MSKGNSFLKGAFILGMAAIIAKILGAAFRIPLGNIIGDEGTGYYYGAYPIYTAFIVISTAGIPTAIAKLVSEKIAIGDRYGAHRIFKISFGVLFIIGLVTSTFLFSSAKYIVQFIKNPLAYYSMLTLAPALFFVSIMSSFRGYFQGLQNMKPTAISQIVESFARAIVGLYLAYIYAKVSMDKAAAGATFGATAGAFFGSIVITYIYFKHRKNIFASIEKINRKQESVKTIVKKLLSIAIPITIGASVLPLMNMIDTGIVIRRLTSIGYEYEIANKLWGRIGLGNNIINLPQAITASLQISIVPAIAYVVAKRNNRELLKNIETGVRVTLLIALPSAVGLSILSKEIMLLLYPMKVEAAIGAGEILRISAWGIIFLSLFQTFTGVLQGIGKQLIPAVNLLIGAILKLILSYILIGIPSLNIKGAVIATLFGYGLACILNIIFVKIYTGMRFNLVQLVIKPVISVGIMGLAVSYSHAFLKGSLSDRLATVTSIAVGAIVFGIMIFLTKTVTEEDLEIMPGGAKLQKLFKVFKGR